MKIRLKIENLINIILLLLIIALLAFNSYNPDYYSYELRYQYHKYGGMETGYGLICSFFSKLGLSFFQYRAFIYIIGTIIILITAKKMTNNVKFVLLSYLLLNMCMDGIQLRSYLVSIVVLGAFPLLLSKKKKDNVIFAILCLISTTIHISAIYYIFLLVAAKIKNTKAYFYFMTMMSLLITFLSYIGITGNFLRMLFKSDRNLVYTYTNAKYGLLIYLVSFFFTALLLYLEVFPGMNFNDINEDDHILLNFIITLIPLYGLMSVNGIFLRVLRPMLIWVFIIISKRVDIRPTILTFDKFIYFIWILFHIVWFYSGSFEETYLYIFKNNMLLGN